MMHDDDEDAPDVDITEGPEPDAPMELRRPDIPVTVSQLAARKSEALEIIDARVRIIQTVRLASIQATHPEDWVLFKAPGETPETSLVPPELRGSTGYLQDSGCQRVRDFWGINVVNVSKPEKIGTNDPKIYGFLVTGDGFSTLTRQRVEGLEGWRSSDQDFAARLKGGDQIIAVRKAARANLDGGITRELAGLKSVPIEELATAWAGTGKNILRCRKGRGFGTREEREGGTRADAPQIPPPVCPHCGTTGVYRSSARGGFYGCPQWKTHEDRKWTVDAKKWEEESAKRPQPASAPAQAAPRRTPPPSAQDIFGPGRREPGEEG